jgi:hypothetical protein
MRARMRARMREMPEFRSPALRSVSHSVFCGRLVRSEIERNGPNAALRSVSHSVLYPERDLNPYALRHTPLKRACLPVSTPGQVSLQRSQKNR